MDKVKKKSILDRDLQRFKRKRDRQQLYKKVINMFNAGYTIMDIWRLTGIKSRVTIYRILRRYDIFHSKEGAHY